MMWASIHTRGKVDRDEEMDIDDGDLGYRKAWEDGRRGEMVLESKGRSAGLVQDSARRDGTKRLDETCARRSADERNGEARFDGSFEVRWNVERFSFRDRGSRDRKERIASVSLELTRRFPSWPTSFSAFVDAMRLDRTASSRVDTSGSVAGTRKP